MGTWDARALVVVGLNRLAVESELIVVDAVVVVKSQCLEWFGEVDAEEREKCSMGPGLHWRS